eukprot:COSAG01_NODE_23222_length_823_cov_1.102210_2_plen_236_part_01
MWRKAIPLTRRPRYQALLLTRGFSSCWRGRSSGGLRVLASCAAGASCGIAATAAAALPSSPPARCDAGATERMFATHSHAGGGHKLVAKNPLRSSAEAQAQLQQGGAHSQEPYNLWAELRRLVLQRLSWLLLGSGAMVLGTVVQARYAGPLAADLTVLLLHFEGHAADSGERRRELLATLWKMVRLQGAVQALNFVGGAVNRIVGRRITRGLQLSMYAELLRRDVALFDRTQVTVT